MTTRDDLKRQYKETPKTAGIFQIINTTNGKILLGSSKNLEGKLNKHRFQLASGRHPNRELQEDWDRMGEDAFRFEIAEVVERKDNPKFNLDDELSLLEEIWIKKTRPCGERGYNKYLKIRE
jgi:hypothetical protein